MRTTFTSVVAGRPEDGARSGLILLLLLLAQLLVISSDLIIRISGFRDLCLNLGLRSWRISATCAAAIPLCVEIFFGSKKGKNLKFNLGFTNLFIRLTQCCTGCEALVAWFRRGPGGDQH